jgi:tetratricopeptide (TPR) repeat protein
MRSTTKAVAGPPDMLIRRKRNSCHIVFVLLVLLGAHLARAQSTQSMSEIRALVESRTNFEEVRGALEKISATEPQNSEAHFLLAKVDYAMADLDSAEKHIEQAVLLSPSASSHLLFGRILSAQIQKANVFRKAGLAARARAQFEAAVASDPRSIPARIGLMDFYSGAPGIVGGSWEKATAQAQEIAKLNEIEGQYAHGDLDLDKKNYAEAEKEYKEAIATDPRRGKSHLKLGVLYLEQGRDQDADTLFQKSLALDPHCLLATFYLGRYRLLHAQELDKAEFYFKAYLAKWPEDGDPTMANAYWRLGQVYEKEGKKDLAAAQWERSLKLDPQFKEAADSLKRMKR